MGAAPNHGRERVGFSSVPVAMMRVRKMRMAVGERLMAVRMFVARSRSHRHVVRMLVVLVMDMGVLVFQRLVRVDVLVALGEVEPNAYGHE